METPNKMSTFLILSLLICLGVSQISLQTTSSPQNTNIRDNDLLPTPSSSTQLDLKKEVYVSQRSGNYYAYKVYSNKGKIVVNLLESDVTEYQFTVKSNKNSLLFRDAYNKFIIIEEMTEQNKTVTYWLLIVTKTTTAYTLDYFAVNSMVDNQGYEFGNTFLLKYILEYNEITNFLYVFLESKEEFDVYGIDLANRGNIMICISYKFYSKTGREIITGGNSRVQVEATTGSFWFNVGNIPKANVQSIYYKVAISSFTNYPIYPQSSRAYSFLSSYFQYVSLSSDGRNMTTFIFDDYYLKNTIYAEASLNSSTKPIKIFSDQQTYFLAIADNDIYVSTVTYNTSILDYSIFSTKVTMFLSDQDEINKWLKVFNSAYIVVYVKGKFFILSENYFYAYCRMGTYEQKLPTSINSNCDLENILFTYIQKYLSNN